MRDMRHSSVDGSSANPDRTGRQNHLAQELIEGRSEPQIEERPRPMNRRRAFDAFGCLLEVRPAKCEQRLSLNRSQGPTSKGGPHGGPRGQPNPAISCLAQLLGRLTVRSRAGSANARRRCLLRALDLELREGPETRDREDTRSSRSLLHQRDTISRQRFKTYTLHRTANHCNHARIHSVAKNETRLRRVPGAPFHSAPPLSVVERLDAQLLLISGRIDAGRIDAGPDRCLAPFRPDARSSAWLGAWRHSCGPAPAGKSHPQVG